MKKFGIGCGALLLVGVVIVIALGLAVKNGYNGLIASSQAVDAKWAQVQNDYQRRADLIPNLVNTVSGAANFEKSTLTEITQARASVGQLKLDMNTAPATAQQLADFQKAQGQLSSALSRLLSVSENYPDLKANSNFRDLQAQLEGTENRIAVARMDFNNAAQAYNTAIKTFPGFLFADKFGFKEKPYFNATPGSEAPPKVQFNFGGAINK